MRHVSRSQHYWLTKGWPVSASKARHVLSSGLKIPSWFGAEHAEAIVGAGARLTHD